MRVYIPVTAAPQSFTIQADLAGWWLVGYQAQVTNPDLLLSEFPALTVTDRLGTLVYQAPASLGLVALSTSQVTWSDVGAAYLSAGLVPGLVIPMPELQLEEGDIVRITEDLIGTTISAQVMIVESPVAV